MLITNGIVNRDINPAKLPEYAAKGYKVVKRGRSAKASDTNENKDNVPDTNENKDKE